jgi:psiF repeat-containing protein
MEGALMKKLIVLIALAGFCAPVLAATAQQEKMKTCNADATAKNLKGDARNKFMSTCLKG